MRDERVVIRKEFPVKPFLEIDSCVVDSFDLKVIVEYFVHYIPGSFDNDTEKNWLEKLNYLSVRFFSWAPEYVSPNGTEETFVYNNFVLDVDAES